MASCEDPFIEYMKIWCNIQLMVFCLEEGYFYFIYINLLSIILSLKIVFILTEWIDLGTILMDKEIMDSVQKSALKG